jgi:glycosyltransferase involved in cell wall biosynthesis
MSDKPFFTVITPTLQRESLALCCSTVDFQTFKSWQHICQVDSADLDVALINKIEHPQREVYSCGKHHNNGGNSCRIEALKQATGKYILFRDDDNFTPDERIFEDVAAALEDAGRPPWGLFPILRCGWPFYADPPRSCHVDTMNVVLRRDIAYWPDTDAYGTDGILVDDLMERKVPYVAFPNFRPIGVIPKISFCK